MSRRVALAALAVAGAPLAAAHADSGGPRAPAEVTEALPGVRLVGQGTLRFLGVPVYEARLWAAEGFGADRYADHPFALELQYARALEGRAIADRSIAEMRRVGRFTDARARLWREALVTAFPDVRPGDRLTGLHQPREGTRFFHNGRSTAGVADAEFAPLFFGIWLSPSGASQGLREALIAGVRR